MPKAWFPHGGINCDRENKLYMENSYLIRMSLFPNLNADRHSKSVISFRLNNLRTESRCFSPQKGQTTQLNLGCNVIISKTIQKRICLFVT